MPVAGHVPVVSRPVAGARFDNLREWNGFGAAKSARSRARISPRRSQRLDVCNKLCQRRFRQVKAGMPGGRPANFYDVSQLLIRSGRAVSKEGWRPFAARSIRAMTHRALRIKSFSPRRQIGLRVNGNCRPAPNNH